MTKHLTPVLPVGPAVDERVAGSAAEMAEQRLAGVEIAWIDQKHTGSSNSVSRTMSGDIQPVRSTRRISSQ